MAKTPQLIMHLILLFLFLVLVLTSTIAARDVPDADVQSHNDVEHPEFFITHDRGYLIPGVGRVVRPKFRDGFNPFTYNPVTGGNDGIGANVPRYGRVGGGNGDDTFVPNPGFEAPSPGGGATAPGPVGN